MSHDVEYFIARGRSAEIVQGFLDALNAHRQAFWHLGRDLGASAPVWQGKHGYGWTFDGMPPDSVREDRRNPGIFVASAKTKAGRELQKRARALPQPQADLVALLWPRRFFVGIPTGPFTRGGQPHTGVGIEKLGDDRVLVVPVPWDETAAPVPPDAEPLARSEYWRRKEAMAAEPAAEVSP